MKIVRLESEIDFEGFRQAARAAASNGLGADAIRFVTETGEEANDLFAEQEAPETFDDGRAAARASPFPRSRRSGLPA